MRLPQNPIITNHSLARLLSWARLWLCWLAGVFLHLDANQRRRALDRAAGLAAGLIVIQATARFRPPPRAAHRHGRLKQRGIRRAAWGSALRRALRGGGCTFARLRTILGVMRDAETHIAALLRRLRRGLTRRRTIAPRPAPVPRLPREPRTPLACADTS